MEAAVTAAYESGLTWEQIGRALSYRKAEGITRQSAHAAYNPAVAEFREQLAAAAARTARGEDYHDGPHSRICNTPRWAPRIDQAATAEHPGMLAPGAQPGAFLATCPTRPPPRHPRSAPGSAARTNGPRGATTPPSWTTPTTASTGGSPAPSPRATPAATSSPSPPRGVSLA